MRTNIVIDDDLMKDAMEATGLKTKRETVEAALRQVVEMRRKEQSHLRAQQDLLGLRGKVEWEGDLAAMRRDRSHALGGR
ncbi:type II toxin-antitoxin system VapB family antitoxin [Consotaella aegiceratis]|uniref:type II toxin-antitoxin system VapB family antitoxin n=1 Tax=Consotaella aegiceratis TaxID=3097961 RepID=UPI002F3E970E